jgi:hypothetical protein
MGAVAPTHRMRPNPPGMPATRLLAELQSLAARLGVTVRAEPFGGEILDGRGGLCRIRGQALVVMDAKLGTEDRIAVLAAALATFDLDGVFVAPVVRRRIEAARGLPVA